MPKMTTEQFLSHLGIEVEQEFGIDDTIYNGFSYHFDGKLIFEYDQCKNVITEFNYTLDWLLDKEIIPLPKYTLSEDDKVIVKRLDCGWNNNDCVYRSSNGVDLYIIRFTGMKDDQQFVLFPMIDILKCIKPNEKVHIKELKMCL